MHPGSSSTPHIRSITLNGPTGRLEALLNGGLSDTKAAALVCHPHPLGGGTMHNKVVYHAMKALNEPANGLGWPVLRFNFRGVGLSCGMHDGMKEREDVAAALDWLNDEFGLPVLLAGFSFGAVMAIEAMADEAARRHVSALCALGLPVRAEGRQYHYPSLGALTMPKLFLSGDRDEFAPEKALRGIVDSAAEPKRFTLIHGADHFFKGALDKMQLAILDWLEGAAYFSGEAARLGQAKQEGK